MDLKIKKLLNSKRRKQYAFCLILSLTLSISLISVNSQISVYTKWINNNNMNMRKIIDLDGDGFKEILGDISSERNIICLNNRGKELWRFPTRGSAYILVGDLLQDGVKEVIAISTIHGPPITSTLVSCLSSEGELIWEKVFDFNFLIGEDIIDVDNDDEAEIVLRKINSNPGYTIILDNLGTIEYQLETPAEKKLLFLDINNDNYHEFVFVSDSRRSCLCYNLTGHLQWNISTGVDGSDARFRHWELIAFDFDKDGILEILIGEDIRSTEDLSIEDKLVFLDLSGNIIRRYNIRYGYLRAPSAVGDIDNDGETDIVFVSPNNQVLCINYLGSVKWEFSKLKSGHGYQINLAFMIDFNGDYLKEVVFVYKHRSFYVLSCRGVLVKRFLGIIEFYNLKTTDLDNDNQKEIIFEKRHNLVCLGIQSIRSPYVNVFLIPIYSHIILVFIFSYERYRKKKQMRVKD